MVLDPVYIVLIAIGGIWLLLFIACLIFVRRVPALDLKGKKVLITGGSEGIGFAVAEECIRRGAFVCIAARREDVLRVAVEKLQKVGVAPNRAHFVRMDVGDEEAVAAAGAEVRQWLRNCVAGGGAASSSGAAAAGDETAPLVGDANAEAPDLVICNAGFSYPARFTEIPSEQGRRMMNVNFFGCVNVVREFLPGMVDRRSGRFVLVSSMAGLAPIAGFSLYGPSKAAVRSFASSMDMEWAWSNVRFQVVNPPDVATPGFDTENKVKSPECKKLCESSSQPFTPDEVAQTLVASIEAYSFMINFGFDGTMLGWLCGTTDPAMSSFALFTEVMLGGILRLVMAANSWMFYGWVKEIREEEEKQKKKK